MDSLFRFGFLMPAICLLLSCGGSGDIPRTVNTINADRMQLDTVFLTKNGREVVAPRGKDGIQVDVIVDSGELVWLALTCTNPNCPGKEEAIEPGDRPFLFIWADPLVVAKPDGSVGYLEIGPDQDRMELVRALGGQMEPACPECLKTRDIDSESDEERQKFVDFCQPYFLPETAARMKELDEEHSRRLKHLEERRNRDVDLPDEN